MRSENDQVFAAIDEAISVARRASIPLQISHYKVTARRLWGSSGKMLAIAAAARREGLDVTLDEYPYTASSSGLDVLLPDRVLQSEGSVRHALARRLSDPARRGAVAADMRRRLHDELGREHLDYAVVASAPWKPEIEGRNLRELNAAAGRADEIDAEILTALEICREGAESGRGGGACGTQMIYHSMSEDDVERIFEDPLTMVARDGGVAAAGWGMPHPRSYGTAARVLARFVRERGLVSLEEAVRKMTSLPASRFGFGDRGLIREGMRADLVLFDPDLVEDQSRYGDPHHESRGFDLVVVNGTIVREMGNPTCERPGMALKGRGRLCRPLPPQRVHFFLQLFHRSVVDDHVRRAVEGFRRRELCGHSAAGVFRVSAFFLPAADAVRLRRDDEGDPVVTGFGLRLQKLRRFRDGHTGRPRPCFGSGARSRRRRGGGSGIRARGAPAGRRRPARRSSSGPRGPPRP